MQASDLEAITARTVIPLIPASRENLDSLLREVARITGYTVQYQTHRVERKSIDEAGTYILSKTLEASGTFTSQNGESASFVCPPSESVPERVDMLKFDTIVGYSVEDHRPGQVALWDMVRSRILNYNSERSFKAK